jgi:hypothetical protein
MAALALCSLLALLARGHAETLWFAKFNALMYHQTDELISVVENTGTGSDFCTGSLCYMREVVWGGGTIWFVKNDNLMYHYAELGNEAEVLNTDGPTNACAGEICHIRDLLWGGGKLWFVKNNVMMYHYPTLGDKSLVLNTDGASNPCAGDSCKIRDPIFANGKLLFVKDNVLMYHYDSLGDKSLELDTDITNKFCVGDICHIRDLMWAEGRLWFVKMNEIMYHPDPVIKDAKPGGMMWPDGTEILNTGPELTTCQTDACKPRELTYMDYTLWFVKNNELMYSRNSENVSLVLNTGTDTGVVNNCAATYTADICQIRELVVGSLNDGYENTLYFVKNNQIMLHFAKMGNASKVLNTDGAPSTCTGDHCHIHDLVWSEERLWFVKGGAIMYHEPSKGDKSFVVDTDAAGASTTCTAGDMCRVHSLTPQHTGDVERTDNPFASLGSGKSSGSFGSKRILLALLCIGIGVTCCCIAAFLYCLLKGSKKRGGTREMYSGEETETEAGETEAEETEGLTDNYGLE